MPDIEINLWLLFIPFFSIFLVTYFIMMKIGKEFKLSGPMKKSFSIFNLEFPGSDAKLSALIRQMDKKTKGKVRLHLLVDFVFMIGIYPSIAILCFIAANAVGEAGAEFGNSILIGLGWAQIIPFAFDFFENQILLHKLKKPLPVREDLFKKLKLLVGIKFMVSILAFTSTIFSFLFLWFIGKAGVCITITIAGLTALLVLGIIAFEIISYFKRTKQESEKIESAIKVMEETSN